MITNKKRRISNEKQLRKAFQENYEPDRYPGVSTIVKSPEDVSFFFVYVVMYTQTHFFVYIDNRNSEAI
jgi:hypothetical protein